jgi:hypothetical protein
MRWPGKAKDGSKRFDQLGLGKARHADEERMATGQHCDERALDDVFLTEDHGADTCLDAGDICERPFGLRDDLFGIGGFRRNGNAHMDLAMLWRNCFLNRYII